MKKMLVCTAALAASVPLFAQQAEEAEIEEEKIPIVSASASLTFDSKYLSYGFVDNDDPVLTPAASLTFCDWLYVGVEAIFDLTTYGRKAGYSLDGGGRSRGGKYTELDPSVGFAHSFSPDDFEWLPTTVELDLGYMYEYHPRSFCLAEDDTQFVTLEVSLPDLWVEPTFLFERDFDRDDGTYLNLELGHGFNLLGADDETLVLRPSAAQGFGNTRRVKGYCWTENFESLDHGGLMDTLLKLTLTWNVCENLALEAYVGYSDFIFDSTIREASRRYASDDGWDESWNFIGGLAISANF